MDLRFSRSEKGFVLETEMFLSHPIEAVFSFFSNAENLELLTPDSLRFKILTSLPIEMGEGKEIEYQLRIYGFPLRWVSLISRWEPPFVFVDEQLRGPYSFWRHEHKFEELPGGTRVRDHVDYSVPGGVLVNRLFVEPDLRRIFRYRMERLNDIFPIKPFPIKPSEPLLSL